MTNLIQDKTEEFDLKAIQGYFDEFKTGHAFLSKKLILDWLRETLKDCQRETLELLLPEKEDVDESSYNDPSIDGTGVSIGVNIARSEILRRASEAGISIDGL